MTDSQKTPGGVFLPAHLLNDLALTPTTLHTWLCLRLLTEQAGAAKPITLGQVRSVAGKSNSTIYAHLAALRELGLLGWQVISPGQMLFTFNDGAGSNNPEREVIPVRETPDMISESGKDNPSVQTESRLSCDGSVEAGAQRSTFPELSRANPLESWNSENPQTASLNPLIKNINQKENGLREVEFQENGDEPENLEREALKVYRQVLGLRPNKAQRQAIGAQVRDLAQWRGTLEHWLAHRWNPKNVPGMLELYGRGGAQGCRFCRQEETKEGKSVWDKLREEIEDI